MIANTSFNLTGTIALAGQLNPSQEVKAAIAVILGGTIAVYENGMLISSFLPVVQLRCPKCGHYTKHQKWLCCINHPWMQVSCGFRQRYTARPNTVLTNWILPATLG
jgi:hypothetical protein